MRRNAVLIVDDEKNIRMTLVKAMESLNCEAVTAVNAEEALVKFRDNKFGLVLLDLKMPGMDGMEALRHFREMRPDIKVIFITAYGSIETAVEAMKMGAVDFLQKPFSLQEVREVAARAMTPAHESARENSGEGDVRKSESDKGK